MYFLLLLDFFVLQNLQNICHSLTGKSDKNQDQQTGRNNDVSVHPCQYQLFFWVTVPAKVGGGADAQETEN